MLKDSGVPPPAPKSDNMHLLHMRIPGKGDQRSEPMATDIPRSRAVFSLFSASLENLAFSSRRTSDTSAWAQVLELSVHGELSCNAIACPSVA